jgi:hypothetical protein
MAIDRRVMVCAAQVPLCRRNPVRGRRPEAEIVGDGNERGQIGKIDAAHC